MNSTLNPKQSDDPHDVLVVAPDVALVAPTDDELSRLARLAHPSTRRPPETEPRQEPGFIAGAAVPPVDTTFRASAVHGQRQRRPVGGSVLRAVTALLLAACIGGAAIAWQSFGYAAKQVVGKWAPQFIMSSSLQQEKSGLPAQPAAAAVEAAASPQPPPAQIAAQSVAPTAIGSTPESAQLLQSMARDLASMGQEIDQLKASIEQIRTSQQQMSRELARSSEIKASDVKASEVKTSEVRNSEQVLRARKSVPPPSAVAPARQRTLPSSPPAAAYPSAAAAYPSAPQIGASYVPRPVEVPRPPITLPSDERDPVPAPRPPMPLR